MASKKILIVDDDPVARRLYQQALAGAGFELIIAVDAMGALTQARTQTPQLILLDLGLPAGGGLMFLERIAAFPALSQIPVIVISSKDRAANEPLAMSAGAVGYIEKPVTPDQLLARVRELLGA